MEESVFVIGIIAALVISYIVSDQYDRRCKQTTRRRSENGAVEANATFFGITFTAMGTLDGGNPILFIGLLLLGFVIRSFVINWEKVA